MRLSSVLSLALLVPIFNCSSTVNNNVVTANCKTDADCSALDMCRDQRCVARATSPDGGAGSEEAGAPDGSEVPDGQAPPEGPLSTCTGSVLTIPTKRLPAILEIVFDGSGSMDSANKWTSAVQGLTAFFDELLATPQPELAVGMLIYEDSKDPTHGAGPYPSAIDVYPQVVDTTQHAALIARLDTTASGGTPTYTALQGGYTTLLNYQNANPILANARRAVALISDGVPNGGTTEQASCVAAATNALAIPHPKGPIVTFSIGVGAFPGDSFSYDPKFMGDVAVAGGTRASSTCNPAATILADTCHIQITPGGSVATMKQAFLDAARRAATGAAGCEVELDLTTPFDASRLQISAVDASGAPTVIPMGGPDGWSLDDDTFPTKIIFSGAACVGATTSTGVKVEACPL